MKEVVEAAVVVEEVEIGGRTALRSIIVIIWAEGELNITDTPPATTTVATACCR